MGARVWLDAWTRTPDGALIAGAVAVRSTLDGPRVVAARGPDGRQLAPELAAAVVAEWGELAAQLDAGAGPCPCGACPPRRGAEA